MRRRRARGGARPGPSAPLVARAPSAGARLRWDLVAARSPACQPASARTSRRPRLALPPPPPLACRPPPPQTPPLTLDGGDSGGGAQVSSLAMALPSSLAGRGKYWPIAFWAPGPNTGHPPPPPPPAAAVAIVRTACRARPSTAARPSIRGRRSVGAQWDERARPLMRIQPKRSSRRRAAARRASSVLARSPRVRALSSRAGGCIVFDSHLS
jgi:hypothetical protein